jgi:hypothetical protein
MYCQEYNNWTNSNEKVSFSIKEVSANLKPTETNDEFGCEGLGFVGLYKRDDGLLFLKMKSDNDLGYELVSFPEIWKIYNTPIEQNS